MKRAFDEVRDALQSTIDFAWFAENWQMLVLTLLGLLLLWRPGWCPKPTKGISN